jgi:hypothetical protein
MSNNDLAEIVAPVFTTPITDEYTKISEDFKNNRTPAIETHGNPEGLIVFQEHIQKHEFSWDSAWSIKPRAFETKDIANGYLSQASKSAYSGLEFLEKLSEKWKILYHKTKIEFNLNGFQSFLIFIAAVIATVVVELKFYKDNGNAFEPNMIWALSSFFAVLFIGIMIFLILDLPFYFFRNRNYKNNPPPLPSWIQDRKNEWMQRLNRIEDAKAEIYEDIEINKKLIQTIKERQIEEHFSGKASSRILAERLATIQAEVEAAINTTKNLNEQHRLTEEIRLKYAKELVDIQRQLKNENNQDLFNKMTMVNDLLGDAP